MAAGTLSRPTVSIVMCIGTIALIASGAAILASRKDAGDSAPKVDQLMKIWLAAAFAAVATLTLKPRASGFEEVRTLLFNPFSTVDVPDAIGNVMLFLPVGVFAALLLRSARHPVATAMGLAVLVSLALELAQFVLPIGRVSGIHDVMSNTVGAFIGVLAAIAATKRLTVPDK